MDGTTILSSDCVDNTGETRTNDGKRKCVKKSRSIDYQFMKNALPETPLMLCLFAPKRHSIKTNYVTCIGGANNLQRLEINSFC